MFDDFFKLLEKKESGNPQKKELLERNCSNPKRPKKPTTWSPGTPRTIGSFRADSAPELPGPAQELRGQLANAHGPRGGEEERLALPPSTLKRLESVGGGEGKHGGRFLGWIGFWIFWFYCLKKWFGCFLGGFVSLFFC